MANDKDLGSSRMMEQILHEIQKMQSNLPNGEMKMMQRNLEDLGESQKEMKEDLSELKKKLLDPNDGMKILNLESRRRIDLRII